MSSLYMRMAAQNIKNHRRSYVPYMFTGMLTAAVYYILHSLANNPGLGETASTMMGLGVAVVAVFSVIFLFYTNSFLMKQRKKEFGLYNVLGMNKGHIARVIGLETLFTALAILAGGIGLGMLLDKLMYLLVARLIGCELRLGFYISVGSIVQTLSLFGAISLVIYLSNIVRVWRAKPIELLQGSNAGEREPKTKAVMAILGAACLAGGYAMSILSAQEAVLAIYTFFIAVILVIIGTYLLFTAGSIAVLKLLRKNKSYYYKTQHFISVSGMLYRMKQNAVGLANICILSTMVLVIISSTCSLWFGSAELIESRYPGDVMLYLDGAEPPAGFTDFLADELQSVPGGDYTAYTFGEENALLEEDGSLSALEDMAGVAPTSMRNLRETAVLPLAEYNRITGCAATLADDEALVFLNSGAFTGSTAELYGKTYKAVQPEKTFRVCGAISANIFDSAVMVVPDYDAYLARAEASYRERGISAGRTAFCISLGTLDDDAQAAFYESFFDHFHSWINEEHIMEVSYMLESRVLDAQEMYALYGSFLFMGVSLGLLFTMAAVLILYYKQISEGFDDKNRFSIMRKVGLSHGEVKRAIHAQILTVFFLPLVAAGIHIVFAFPIVNCILHALLLRQVMTFIVCTVVTFLVFSVFYAIVYALTAKVYYRIVSE
ncbi:MAG: ABC transporter permease [Ruminococcus bromii]|nr:ABC transporter permease [Ruminococcus bromii]